MRKCEILNYAFSSKEKGASFPEICSFSHPRNIEYEPSEISGKRSSKHE